MQSEMVSGATMHNGLSKARDYARMEMANAENRVKATIAFAEKHGNINVPCDVFPPRKATDNDDPILVMSVLSYRINELVSAAVACAAMDAAMNAKWTA